MIGRRFLVIFLPIWITMLITSVVTYALLILFPNFASISLNYLDFAKFLMPLLLIIAVNIIAAVIASAIIYFFLYKDENKLETRLNALLARKYDSPVFAADEDDLYTNDKVNAAVLKLNESFQNIEMALQAKTIADEATTELNRNEIVKEERQRIARELHDSVSQQLFAMTMLLSAIQEQAEALDPVNRQLINKVAEMVDQAQAEMRSLLLHLRPISLTSQSLAEGIEQLFTELETKVQIQFEAKVNDVHLQAEIENHLFRIVQELLSNSLRHAKADMIECQLYEKDRHIYLRFSDDGVGFDTDKAATNSGGYGLKNIRERVLQLGGNINIVSFKNQGSLVQIVVPKKMEEEYD